MREQYILGINGWDIRSHDASASLIKCTTGGLEIIAAAEEERFVRKKHAYDTLPYQAVKFCLEQGNISPEDIDTVAFSWDMFRLYEDRKLRFEIDKKELLDRLFGKKLRNTPNLEFVSHHLSHVLSTFSPSGFDSAVVLVIDGQGEKESVSVWKADGENIKQLSTSDISSSPGYFYEALTEFVGFKLNQAGKTMGLAPYGDQSRFSDTLLELFQLEELSIHVPSFTELVLGKRTGTYLPLDEQSQVRDFWFRQFTNITGLNPNDRKKRYSFKSFPRDYLDLAASGQKILEQIVVHLAGSAIQATGEKNICLAGGVALNCIANGMILQRYPLNLYVPPAPHDAGTSMGAAFEIARRQKYPISSVKMNPYLGREYTNQQVLEVLRSTGVTYKEECDMLAVIGRLIAQGKVLGIFQGRFEFGPRALGNRSFIADPQIEEMLDYINEKIKSREEGRPLAPTVLDSATSDLFGTRVDGPYMAIAYKLANMRLSAVTHVDGSTRPQILEYEDNPVYFQQIRAVGNDIGVDAVINTSLNLQEPMVNSPQEALDLLARTHVDAVVFNNTFIAYRK